MKETGKDISNKETPDIDIDKEKEQEGGTTREGRLLSEQIDSLKRKNAILKGQIEILEEKMFGNTPLEVDKIEQIMEWHKSLMPELFGSHTGRNAIAAKIKEKVKNLYSSEGYVTKIKISESAIRNLCYGIDTQEYSIEMNLKLDVAYDYVVDCHGMGLCFDNGSVVYIRIGDWGDFEVVNA